MRSTTLIVVSGVFSGKMGFFGGGGGYYQLMWKKRISFVWRSRYIVGIDEQILH